MRGLLLGLPLLLAFAACDAPAGAPDATPAPIADVDTAAPDDTPPCVVELDTAAEDTGAADTAADTAAPDDTATDTAPSGPPIVVYAIRHAEKDSGDDPGLTEEGQARALALVDVLHDVPLVAIYATDLVRTQETVAPTAADHGLSVVTDIDPEEELAAHILATHAGESVLHAGHSYTLEAFMEALGLPDAPSAAGYGDLWIITITPEGEVTLETSCFGA